MRYNKAPFRGRTFFIMVFLIFFVDFHVGFGWWKKKHRAANGTCVDRKFASILAFGECEKRNGNTFRQIASLELSKNNRFKEIEAFFTVFL